MTSTLSLETISQIHERSYGTNAQKEALSERCLKLLRHLGRFRYPPILTDDCQYLTYLQIGSRDTSNFLDHSIQSILDYCGSSDTMNICETNPERTNIVTIANSWCRLSSLPSETLS
jgi:hypothetical protein